MWAVWHECAGSGEKLGGVGVVLWDYWGYCCVGGGEFGCGKEGEVYLSRGVIERAEWRFDV